MQAFRRRRHYKEDPEGLKDVYLGPYENYKEVRKEKVLHDKKLSKAAIAAGRQHDPLKIITDATADFVQETLPEPEQPVAPAIENKRPSDVKGI